MSPAASSPSPAQSPVLVTGATGFFGSHLVRVLRQRGYPVRALVRHSSDSTPLTAQRVEVVRGDLGDPASLARATEGVRLVFHAAGRVTDWGTRDQFQYANVQGTERLLAASRRAGVSRLVHLSSLTVLGLPRDGRTVDEDTPYAKPRRSDWYSESKMHGEQRVRDAHGRDGLSTVVVRPGAIWGPGDTIILPRLVRLLRRGVMPYIGDGSNLLGLSWVENLVDGAILAAEVPAAGGQVFHVTDSEVIDARTAVSEISATLGLAAPRISVPYPVLYALALGVEKTGKALRLENPPPMTRYGVRFVACHCRYDVTRAREVLGYRPAVTFREGLRRLGTGPL